MAKKLFGTDGIRGVANIEPMTAETALKLGRAIAYVFKNRHHEGRHRIVIGKDTRLSGYMLENAMVAGICSMGVDVLIVGPLPTPGIAFITNSMRADAGVVISASHNLYGDNGIKFFSRNGFKLSDELELKIEDYIFNESETHGPTEKEIGKAYRIEDAIGRYVQFAKSTFPSTLSLEGLKIVVDCANGATYKVAPEVFYELGADVVKIGCEPNGTNINKNCGALYPQDLAKKVLEEKADIGIALDGDGDRLIMVDEKGKVIDGDYIMAICATAMLARNSLKNKTLVATIMSNSGLEEAIERAGGKVVRTDVGDRHVVAEMRKEGHNFGGEQSGHLIFSDHTTTGDGVISSLQILKEMVSEKKPLSELAKCMKTYPQVLLNVTIKEKKPLEENIAICEALNKVKESLKNKGRAFIRYSGTEKLVRITVEGQDEKTINEMAKNIEKVLIKELC